MIYIETNRTKPNINLAYEEYFLTQSTLDEDIFMLWQNEPTIVVGRFQNTIEEVNRDYVEENHIHVIRRMTGGGAVYHDFGNLCYSFILNNVAPENADFSILAVPVVNALEKIGIHAEISGRNDLTIDGKKFSGTAMCLHKNKLLFHGTLLYDSDLQVLAKALNVSVQKLESKGIQSVKSRVANIKSYLKLPVGIHEFKAILKNEMFLHQELKDYIPTEEDCQGIEELSQTKYLDWNWTYGNNPEATVVHTRRYSGGAIQAFLCLEGGFIKTCSFRGDFLGIYHTEPVEEALRDVKYDCKDVVQALQRVDVKHHFGAITLEQVVDCIMNKFPTMEEHPMSAG